MWRSIVGWSVNDRICAIYAKWLLDENLANQLRLVTVVCHTIVYPSWSYSEVFKVSSIRGGVGFKRGQLYLWILVGTNACNRQLNSIETDERWANDIKFLSLQLTPSNTCCDMEYCRDFFQQGITPGSQASFEVFSHEIVFEFSEFLFEVSSHSFRSRNRDHSYSQGLVAVRRLFKFSNTLSLLEVDHFLQGGSGTASPGWAIPWLTHEANMQDASAVWIHICNIILYN